VSEHTMTGSGDKMTLERVLGRVTVAGDPVAPLATMAAFPEKKDLRASKIDERRTFTFTQLNDDKTFLLNGKKFDHTRIDTRVPLGNTEEWTIKNDTDDMHVFHIHQIHFQLVEINGKPQPFEGYLDDVRVPERGEVKLILPFTEAQIVGTFMYHCHVLKHEDGGMMGIIEVYDPKSADASPPEHHH
jgi:suppressor of ftsI